MAEARRRFPCPKCKRSLVQSGELKIEFPAGDYFAPTFQCDECIVNVDFAGEMMEAALTFALDQEDQPFDPAAPDGRLPLE